jgi:hypothetical protein
MQNSEAKIWKSAAGRAKQSDQRRSFQPWLNCRTVGLAQRVVFLLRFTHLCAVFSRKNFVRCKKSRPGRNNTLGQAHSPAIEPGLKLAPLAGLFRPAGLLLPRSPSAAAGLSARRGVPDSISPS